MIGLDSRIFPIPSGLEEAVIASYRDHQTNYPGAVGLPGLREGVKNLVSRYAGVDYALDEIQISCGSRPLIYSMYRSVLDPGDTVVFPVPSWMNDAYCHLCSARGVTVDTDPEDNFMPTAAQIEPFLGDAAHHRHSRAAAARL